MAASVRPITVERAQASLQDSELSTAQTVERMAQHIKDGAQDPAVIQCAHDAVRRFAGGRPGAGSAVWSVWWAAHHYIKFVPDDQLFNRRICLQDGRCVTVPGDNELEMLVSPGFMVRMQKPRGDCDDFTDVQLSMLAVLGVPYRIVTVKANPRDPSEWSHVYGLAILEDGSVLPMDASHGKYPGWEVPKKHILQYQEWDADGRPVAPLARAAGNTLHGITRRRRGMGDPTIDETGDPYVPVDSNLQPASSAFDTATGFLSAGGASPFAAPSQWASTVGNLLNQWTGIAGRVIAPQTTMVRGPNGQLYYSTPGSGTIPSSITAGVGSISPTMIALGIGAVILFGLMGRRK